VSIKHDQDIEFLVKRAGNASRISFTEERDTGMSSNSIVSIAYGYEQLENQIFPSDMGDLKSCRNMWKNLPEHRKTDIAIEALKRAEAKLSGK
jgi:hypothetical protein